MVDNTPPLSNAEHGNAEQKNAPPSNTPSSEESARLALEPKASSEQQPSTDHSTDTAGSNGFFAILQSTLAAILGVQSSKNRERDFKKGDPTQYIIAGVITVFLILIGMYSLVSHVIATAKPH